MAGVSTEGVAELNNKKVVLPPCRQRYENLLIQHIITAQEVTSMLCTIAESPWPNMKTKQRGGGRRKESGEVRRYDIFQHRLLIL